jgi:glucosyl-dolichyl phosphate glucuronosyltransferase
MDNPYISVIVCTYNRDKYLNETLDHLSNQSLSPSNYEIILIDNNSSDNTPEICLNFAKNHPKVNFKYFKEISQGLSWARNRGINESTGELLVFIDDDAMCDFNYLEEIKKFFATNKDYKAGGGLITPKYEMEKPKWMSSFMLSLVSAIDLGKRNKVFPSNKYPIGANMFFTKEVFKKYGAFNTELGRKGQELLGGEEKDLFNRMKKSGEKFIYLAFAKVNHIIPEKRLSLDYIFTLGKGIGKSEVLRYRSQNKHMINLIVKELFKWIASLALFFFYLIILNPSKGIILIRFRNSVSAGILNTINI